MNAELKAIRIKWLGLAILFAVITLLSWEPLNICASYERGYATGYKAFGGEDLLHFFGIFLTLKMLYNGVRDTGKLLKREEFSDD